MKKHKKEKINTNHEQGDVMVEFAIALPIFIILMAAIGWGAWLSFTQNAADISAILALREGSFNRGENTVLTQAGPGYFTERLPAHVGPESASYVGVPQVQHLSDFRMVTLQVNGNVDFSFGPLTANHNYGGGGAGRFWLFYPGPPDPWE